LARSIVLFVCSVMAAPAQIGSGLLPQLLRRCAHRADHSASRERDASTLISARTRAWARARVAGGTVHLQSVRRATRRLAREDPVAIRIRGLAGRVNASVFAPGVLVDVAGGAARRLIALAELAATSGVARRLAARRVSPLFARCLARLVSLAACGWDIAAWSASHQEARSKQ
jgi:hypothetical protein